jgi:hypothetical protein
MEDGYHVTVFHGFPVERRPKKLLVSLRKNGEGTQIFLQRQKAYLEESLPVGEV